jgi:hypothetical protein
MVYPGTTISSTNKTDRHGIAEIMVESGGKHHKFNRNAKYYTYP